MAPLLVESFQNTPRTQSEASQFSVSGNYKTKLPSFIIDRQQHWQQKKTHLSDDFEKDIL
jgi:hypothetical protein